MMTLNRLLTSAIIHTVYCTQFIHVDIIRLSDALVAFIKVDQIGEAQVFLDRLSDKMLVRWRIN